MKILITGCRGQVGFELQRSLALLGKIVAVDRAGCDLASEEIIRGVMRAQRPDVVVNAAAYTAVDKAEQDQTLAEQVNGRGPGILAEEAAALGALLVHYSTDYVFDGEQPTPYGVDTAPNPRSVYGLSKWHGEQAIQAVGKRHLILRTSWVYGAYGTNFLKTMLRLMRERDALSVVSDQVGAPTGAALIADVTSHILARYIAGKGAGFAYGTHHLVASGDTSWYDYARFIGGVAEQAGMALRVSPGMIKPISTQDYPVPARRPAYSRLDTTSLCESFGVVLPEWQAGVRQVVQLLASLQGK